MEYICYKCHRRIHNKPNVYKEPLPKPARQRRLNEIALHYGPTFALVLDNNKNIQASKNARKMGISRERIRQFLVQLHGNYDKHKTSKKRKIKNDKYKWIIDILIKHNIIVEKLKHNYIVLANNKSFHIRRILGRRGTSKYSVLQYGKPVDYNLIFDDDRNVYVIPWGTFKYFNDMEDIQQYREKFEFLLKDTAKRYTAAERISLKAKNRYIHRTLSPGG